MLCGLDFPDHDATVTIHSPLPGGETVSQQVLVLFFQVRNPGRVAFNSSVSCRQDRQDPGLKPPGDVHATSAVDEHIHFAPDAELLEVNPRFDRETGAPEDSARRASRDCPCWPLAVDFLPDVMADPVDEVSPIPGLVNYLAARGVDLLSVEGPAGRIGLAHARNRRITALGHDRENLFVFLGTTSPTNPIRVKSL